MAERIAFLIVEDVAVLRRALVRRMSSYGRADGVGSYKEAQKALRKWRYDSMILDVALPDGIGLDLVPYARSLWPAIWVLVLTGSHDHSVITRIHELGVRYLLKPFHPAQLKVHADETETRRAASDRRMNIVLDRWTRGHDLTSSEAELLALGAHGVPRDQFSIIRGVQPDTIRKQIQSLLQKTGDTTFEAAVNTLLREAIAEE